MMHDAAEEPLFAKTPYGTTINAIVGRIKMLEHQGSVLIIMSGINLFVNVMTIVGALLFAA